VNLLQLQTGILRWCVELGCIEIITDVSMLSTYLCIVHEGCMDTVFHVCPYLVHHQNVRFVFDPTYPAVHMCAFVKTDWNWGCEGIASF
jgi:hypothetical protein